VPVDAFENSSIQRQKVLFLDGGSNVDALSVAVALVAAIVEAQEPIAVRTIVRSVVIEDECRRILGPLVANERFEDLPVPCFLTGNDAPNPILSLNVPACLIEEVAVALGIPGGVAIVKFYLVERIVVEIE
jgi:hypothetical protein